MASVLVSMEPVAKFTMKPPSGCTATPGVMVIGCAGTVVYKAATEGAPVDRSNENFHMVPSRSPAYTVSMLPSLSMSNAAGVHRPFGLPALPVPAGSAAVAALVAWISAPVLALITNR